MNKAIQILISQHLSPLSKKIEEEGISAAELEMAAKVSTLIYNLIEIEEYAGEMVEEVKDHAKDELMSAEEYIEMYESGKDSDYLKMANDELSHAKKFLTEKPNAKMLAWHKNLSDRLVSCR